MIKYIEFLVELSCNTETCIFLKRNHATITETRQIRSFCTNDSNMQLAHTQNSCHHLKMFSDLVFFSCNIRITLLLHFLLYTGTDKILVIYEYFWIHVAFYFIIKSCHRFKNTQLFFREELCVSIFFCHLILFVYHLNIYLKATYLRFVRKTIIFMWMWIVNKNTHFLLQKVQDWYGKAT